MLTSNDSVYAVPNRAGSDHL